MAEYGLYGAMVSNQLCQIMKSTSDDFIFAGPSLVATARDHSKVSQGERVCGPLATRYGAKK